jgi:hypothetical protein
MALSGAYLENLDYFIPRRQKELDYIKRVHSGSVHWLNTIKLTKQLILTLFDNNKLIKRTHRWFILGLSLGRILELTNVNAIARGLLQLIEEYEYYCNHSNLTSTINNTLELKNSLFYTHRKPLPQQLNFQLKNNENEPIKVCLHKINRTVVYEFLLLPFQITQSTNSNQLNLATESMDYCEIVHSLCDVLNLLYSKCLDDTTSLNNSHVKEAIIKFDKSIKKLFISKVCSDLTEIASQVLQKEMLGLLNHMFVDQSRSSKIMRCYYQLQENKNKNENKENDDFFNDSDKEI